MCNALPKRVALKRLEVYHAKFHRARRHDLRWTFGLGLMHRATFGLAAQHQRAGVCYSPGAIPPVLPGHHSDLSGRRVLFCLSSAKRRMRAGRRVQNAAESPHPAHHAVGCDGPRCYSGSVPVLAAVFADLMRNFLIRNLLWRLT